ncbi:YcgL domain-containing protein [Natronospirillum operosum]|uniref:YcgL domain-containing protein E4656_03780 n=1 Tax=Natronospirillum operosum TaxID=2759953 RepID=A0A4Z0WI42_9GAMM|nr:YcgL domain-containing protein [Natronospirillum operosum]TGG95547.1 YcgL domain-containing protein [Natronospirillum operosum]
MERQLVRIYRSPHKPEMYLYVIKARGLQDVPEDLLAHFGKPKQVMDMLLTAERRLARVEATRVLEQLATRGYYLQMPPAGDDYMLDLYRDTADRYRDIT